METHWYKVDFLDGEKYRAVVGTSPLSAAELIEQLQEGEFLLLSDLKYRDNQGQLQPYSKWDPLLPPTMFINPKYILTVMPYDSDPVTSHRP